MGITPVLSVMLNVDYSGKGRVLNGVCLDLAPGEILGLVGQSGSGKSTLALSILRLLSFKGGSDPGSILFRGNELLGSSEREMRKLRGNRMILSFGSDSPDCAGS